MKLVQRIFVTTAVLAVILLALLTGAIRLAINNIEYYKPEIEYLLERELTPGFVFTGINGAMNRFNPILGIENVSITLPDRSQPLFIDRLTVEFDFWSSLREWAPVVREISGQLERLEVVKDESGKWWTSDFMIGGGGGPVAVPAFREVLALLPRYLKIDLNRLVIRDQKTGSRHQLDRISAHIQHRREQFYMQLSAALPEEFGSGVLLKSVIGPERSLVYVNSSNLKLAPLARLFDVDNRGLRQGALDGEVWVNMAGFDLLAVNGDLILKNGIVQVADDKTPFSISYRSRFNAIARPSSWRITSRFERLQIDENRVPPFKAQIELGSEQSNTRVQAWIDHLRLASLPVIAGQWLPQDLNRQIAQGRLQGLLRDVLLSIDLEQPRGLLIGGRASDMSIERLGELPGMQNINATFVAGNDRLGLDLDGQQVRLDFGDHFRAPFEFEQLELRAHIERRGESTVIAVEDMQLQNPDIKASGRMWMEAESGQRSFMYIRSKFVEGDGASTGKYLPRRILPQKPQAWLDRAIRAGTVPEGELLFHGRLRSIRDLARERAGELFVDFAIEEAELSFAPDWRPAKNAAGRILFHNAGMSFDIERADYDRIEGAQVRGGIDDFKKARLNLEITTAANAAQAVQTWLDMPVGERYRSVMRNFEGIDGAVQARVDLGIPLTAADDDLNVRVLVDFENAAARAEQWGLDLAQINGRLTVTEDSIDAKGLRARFFGDPVSIDIGPEAGGGATLVSASGKLESSNLFRIMPRTVTESIEGKSDWQIRLRFPAGSDDSQPFLYLNAASNLKDTAIELPAPLQKVAAGSKRLAVNLDFYPRKIRFDASLGNDLRSRGTLEVDREQNYRLQALEVALAEKLRGIKGPGAHVYGYMPELAADDWLELSNSFGKAGPGLLQSATLKLDRVLLSGRVFENVVLELNQIDELYLGTIDSTLLRGSFQVPVRPTPLNPIVAELRYLQINKLAQKTDYSAMRPAQFPGLRLSSEVVVYHDMRFEDLRVEARTRDDVLNVDKINLRLAGISIDGSAQWKYDAQSDRHVSTLSATIEGENLGEAIAGIGFGDTMRGGTVKFEGGFTWPAPILGFEVANVVGDARLKIEDGVLNNVEPGSGRFVGLLSLNALPRRLSLDFSDVLIEGMEFDEIDGRYQMQDGFIHTSDTRMDGPAAVIKISGKTGLVDRDYDQTIKVVPKIRQTLPIIGVVSGGATLGWGLLLLQNLFKKTIDDAVEVEYRVTGSWDDPRIELIKAVDENQQELPEIEDTSR